MNSESQDVSEGEAGEDAAPPQLDTASFQALLSDVPLNLAVELGRVSMNLADLASRLGPGSIIPLNKMTGDRLDVRVNGRLVARAEAVAVGERTGIRIVEIVHQGDVE